MPHTSEDTLASPLAALLQSSQLWHADALAGSNVVVCPSGFDTLDRVLPYGGWPCSSLIEVLTDASASTDWSLILPALPALLRPQRSLLEPQMILIDPPHEPCLAALFGAQIAQSSILRLNTHLQLGAGVSASAGPARACWAVEQALHCAQVAVVLAWLPRVPASGRALLMVFRPSGSIANSPAPLRISLHRSSALSCELSILKCRGLAGERAVHIDLLNASLRALLQAPKRRRTHHGLDRTSPPTHSPQPSDTPILINTKPRSKNHPERSVIRAARLARSY
jgi:protein ImuA